MNVSLEIVANKKDTRKKIARKNGIKAQIMGIHFLIGGETLQKKNFNPTVRSNINKAIRILQTHKKAFIHLSDPTFLDYCQQHFTLLLSDLSEQK